MRYNRAEIRASDHKPVFALIRAKVRVIDRALKKSIRQEAMDSIGQDDLLGLDDDKPSK